MKELADTPESFCTGPVGLGHRTPASRIVLLVSDVQ
jgi:hypothetical protein